MYEKPDRGYSRRFMTAVIEIIKYRQMQLKDAEIFSRLCVEIENMLQKVDEVAKEVFKRILECEWFWSGASASQQRAIEKLYTRHDPLHFVTVSYFAVKIFIILRHMFQFKKVKMKTLHNFESLLSDPLALSKLIAAALIHDLGRSFGITANNKHGEKSGLFYGELLRECLRSVPLKLDERTIEDFVTDVIRIVISHSQKEGESNDVFIEIFRIADVLDNARWRVGTAILFPVEKLLKAVHKPLLHITGCENISDISIEESEDGRSINIMITLDTCIITDEKYWLRMNLTQVANIITTIFSTKLGKSLFKIYIKSPSGKTLLILSYEEEIHYD
jgi:hypothetical protein